MRVFLNVNEIQADHKEVDPSFIRGMVADIQHQGLLKRLVVLRKKDGSYKLLDGYVRLMALRELKRNEIEVDLYEETNEPELFCNILCNGTIETRDKVTAIVPEYTGTQSLLWKLLDRPDVQYILVPTQMTIGIKIIPEQVRGILTGDKDLYERVTRLVEVWSLGKYREIDSCTLDLIALLKERGIK